MRLGSTEFLRDLRMREQVKEPKARKGSPVTPADNSCLYANFPLRHQLNGLSVKQDCLYSDKEVKLSVVVTH